jgi:hypothetical protein
MWPFSSSYLTIVDAKRAERTRALKSAVSATPLGHEQSEFTKATGQFPSYV